MARHNPRPLPVNDQLAEACRKIIAGMRETAESLRSGAQGLADAQFNYLSMEHWEAACGPSMRYLTDKARLLDETADRWSANGVPPGYQKVLKLLS